jgi:hypothetical protein
VGRALVRTGVEMVPLDVGVSGELKQPQTQFDLLLNAIKPSR